MKKPISQNLQKIFRKNNDFAIQCLEKWNDLSIKKHKEKTKKFNEIKMYVEQLRMGSFNHGKAIDKKFLEQHGIPIEFLTKRHTSNQILNAIKNLKYFYMEGYFPLHKKFFPKDLDVLIYNKEKRISFLLVTLHKKPEPLKQYGNISKEVQELLDIAIEKQDVFGKDFNKGVFVLNVKSIIEFKNKIPDHLFNISKIKSDFGDVRRIFINYSNWLYSKSWIEMPVSVKNINSESKLFQKFIEEMELNYHGYKLSY